MGARRKRRGMSLVEVMVVVAIILVLMTVLAMGVERGWRSSQVSITLLTMGKVDGELVAYEARHGQRPPGRDGLAKVYGADGVPADAWGTELVYEPPSPDSDLISLGADGVAGGTGYQTDLRWSEHRK